MQVSGLAVKYRRPLVLFTKFVEPGSRDIVFDPEARLIRRGKSSLKAEFGYKALLTETEDRVITHYEVQVGNPADSGLLAAAPAGYTQIVPRTPRVVATDPRLWQQGP